MFIFQRNFLGIFDRSHWTDLTNLTDLVLSGLTGIADLTDLTDLNLSLTSTHQIPNS